MATFEIQRLPGAPKQRGRLEPGQRMVDWLDGQKLHNSVLLKLNGKELTDDFDIGYRFGIDDHLSVFDQPQNMGGIKDLIKLSAPWEALNPIKLTKKALAALQKTLVGDIKKTPSVATGESPNNDLTGQTNVARLYKGRPNIYGQVRSYPDLIQESLFEYINNKKYVTEFMEIGYGRYDISSVRYSESSLTAMAGASYQIYQPGEVIGTINEGYAFDDVDGQELPGLNEDTGVIKQQAAVNSIVQGTYAGGQISIKIIKNAAFDYFFDAVKPLYVTFIINVTYSTASGSVTKNITVNGTLISATLTNDGAVINPVQWYTFVFSDLAGNDITETPATATINTTYFQLTEYEGTVVGPFFSAVESSYLWFHLSGSQGGGKNGPVTIKWWAVDDDNDIVPGTEQSLAVNVKNNSGDQDYVYYTFKVQPTAGKTRYAFSLQRTNNSSNSSTLYILAAHAINVRSNVVYPNDTLVKVTVQETENASGIKDRKYNLLAERLVISYNRTTGAIDYTLRASRSFADAVLHEWVMVAKQDVNRLDLATLYAIADSIADPQLSYFDYTFSDSKQSLGERIQIICNAARVDINWIGDVLTFWRDERVDVPAAVFGRSNMFWDDFKMGYSMSLPNGYDGIALDYVDPRTNKKAYIYLQVDTSGVSEITTQTENAMTISLSGCRNLTQARNRAWLEANRLVQSRLSMTVKVFETTQVVRGAVVQCPDMYDNDQQTGYLKGREGNVFFTSERLAFTGDMWVVMTDSLGNFHGRYRAYPVTGNEKAFTANAEAFDLNIYDGRKVQTPSRYFIASSNELNSTLWRVESSKPNGDDTQTLSLVEYSDEIYLND
ncbi:host specificity factor TipJ family phage tail protein [Franconibacter daqui]|uniref:host specificity factor TipJ family phage tail protein n=1 Tax=Franconibacter daqui TaxID=2047724 RepID=UPI002DB7289C|nr:host specificity factor TipJ family phage tail protein [Franconibacter daqui]MEB5922713.1 host specificity factor TipJ family phage tail protein [Franconibacter daqui]